MSIPYQLKLPGRLLHKAKTRAFQTMQIATLAGSAEIATCAVAPWGTGATTGLLAIAFGYAVSKGCRHIDYKTAYFDAPDFSNLRNPPAELQEKHKHLTNYLYAVAYCLRIRTPHLTIGTSYTDAHGNNIYGDENGADAYGNENYSNIRLGLNYGEKSDAYCENVLNHELAHIISDDSGDYRLNESVRSAQALVIPLALTLGTQSTLDTAALVAGIVCARALAKNGNALLTAQQSQCNEYQADKLGLCLSEQMKTGEPYFRTMETVLKNDISHNRYCTHPSAFNRLKRIAKHTKTNLPK